MTAATQRPPLARTTVEQIGTFVAIKEAGGFGLDRARRTARVILITEGLGNLRDRNFYTREAIQTCAAVFEGKQFYLDHPSRTEEESRPERSVRDLAGYFFNCGVGQVKDPKTGEPLAACFANLKFSESEAGNLAMAQVATALEYQAQMKHGKDVYAGISINAGGLSEPGEIDGQEVNMVRAIHDAFSADIVTKPARGGKFLSLVQEAARSAAWKRPASGRPTQGDQMNLKKLTEAERERYIDLKTKAADKATPLTEAEQKELDLLVTKGTTKTREAGADDTETPTADEQAGEAKAEAEGEAAEGEEGEAEADPMAGMEKLAEGILGKIKAARTPKAEGEGEAAGEEAPPAPMGDEDTIGPVDANDPAALLDDIRADLAALAELLGGGGDGNGEPAMDDAGAGDLRDDMADEGGERPMNYKCTACGENNEVLPPKGYRLSAMGESDKPAPKLGGVYREAAAALRRKLEAKEERFAVRNGDTRKLIEQNVDLKVENTMLKREKQAAKLLREAQIPGDILSVAEMMKVDPTMWEFMIKTAKGRQTMESRLTESNPAGTGGVPGAQRGGDGAKDAIAAFDAGYSR